MKLLAPFGSHEIHLCLTVAQWPVSHGAPISLLPNASLLSPLPQRRFLVCMICSGANILLKGPEQQPGLLCFLVHRLPSTLLLLLSSIFPPPSFYSPYPSFPSFPPFHHFCILPLSNIPALPLLPFLPPLPRRCLLPYPIDPSFPPFSYPLASPSSLSSPLPSPSFSHSYHSSFPLLSFSIPSPFPFHCPYPFLSPSLLP